MPDTESARPALAAGLLCAVLLAGGCGGEPAAGEAAAGEAAAGEDRAAAGPPSGAASRSGGGELDVLLITLDTLRADALGFAGNERVETPVLDRLAAQGRVYTFAHAHNVVTLPSHANILTGRYPYEHGIRDNTGFTLPAEMPTLATLLAADGYATAAFVAALPLDARYGLDRGFQVYDEGYPEGSSPAEFVMPERRGDAVVAGALAWWRAHAGERRFLWVHLYDPHAPYAPPEPFASRYADAPYLGEVAATDSFLAPLLEPFTDAEEEPALVVVTSDHGEALGDHGEQTHGLFAYEATLEVPLVLWGPPVEPGTDDRPAAHVDLLPTVLAATGVAAPDGLPGRSLLAPGDSAEGEGDDSEREIYFEALSTYLNRDWAPLYGVLRGRDKYIHLPQPELYDLAEDPEEGDNLVARRERLAGTLRGALPRAASRPPERQAVSDEEARRLAALGYLSGGGPRRQRFTAADDPKNLVGLDAKIHRVVELYAARQLEEAARLARQVVDERPSMPVGYERLATVLKEQGRLEESNAVLRQALGRGIAHPSVIRQLGLGLAEAGRGKEAVEVLAGAAESDDPDTLNALGVAYFTAGNPARARAILERLLKLDPDNPKALENLGAVELAAGRPAVAEAHLERALAINPRLPISWNTLGVVRHGRGDVDGALAAWQQAVELDPGMSDALYNLARVAASERRLELAYEALSRYVATAPAGTPEMSWARGALAELEAIRRSG